MEYSPNKPTKKEKKANKNKETTISLVNGKEDIRAKLNSGAISRKSVKCECNKCKAVVYGTLINYIHLKSNNKSIPFVNYSCASCGHFGYRSVQEKALPAEEFDTLYFS